MSAFSAALQDFLLAVEHDPPREVALRAHHALETVVQLDQESATWGIMALIPLLADADCPYHALCACLAEPLMRQGGDPWLVVGLLAERLRDGLVLAQQFHDKQRAQPHDDYRVQTLDWLVSPLLPVVNHFPPARRLLRADPAALDSAYRLARGSESVAELLRILDGHGDDAGESQEDEVRQALAELSAAPRGGVSAALRELYRAVFAAELATRNLALAGLAERIATAEVAALGELGRMAGSLAETGGDPSLACAALMARLPEVLELGGKFVERCRAQGSADEPLATLVSRHGERLAPSMPREAAALASAGSLCLGAIAMLSRSVALRRRHCGDARLVPLAWALAEVVAPAGFLRKMLQVLDDELIVVLDPEREQGWQARIRGVADNFQLHALLAGALVGPAAEGGIPTHVGVAREGEAEPPVPGRPLDRRAVELARALPCTRDDLTVWSRLQLWTWPALQADGSLPDNPPSPSGPFIWNEGVPADIPAFEGTRIILVGESSYERSWNGGRIFSGMAGDLRVEKSLNRDEARDLLHRLAVAPRE